MLHSMWCASKERGGEAKMSNGKISTKLDEELDRLLKTYTGYLDGTSLKGELVRIITSVDANAEGRGRDIVGNELDKFVRATRLEIKKIRKRDIVDHIDWVAAIHKNEILPE